MPTREQVTVIEWQYIRGNHKNDITTVKKCERANKNEREFRTFFPKFMVTFIFVFGQFLYK